MRKWLRRLAWGLGTLCVLLVAGAVVAHWRLSGANGARFVENQLNPRIRGRVEVGAIDWSLGSLVSLDTRLPVKIHGIKVYDPGGKQVLDVPEATGVIDWWEIATGHHDIIVDDLTIHGGTCLVEQYETPGGLRPTEIGFTAAFHPKERPSEEELRRPGSIIHLRSLALDHVELQLHFLKWSADLHELSTKGTLWNSGRDFSKHDFVYDLAPKAASAELDIGKVHVDLRNVDASRFGQYRPRNDALAFVLTADTTDGAKLAIDGELNDLYNPEPHAGGVVLNLDLERGGKLVERLSQGHAGGDDLGAKVALSGLMSGPAIHVDAHDVVTSYHDETAVVRRVVAGVDLTTNAGTLDTLDIAALDGNASASGTVKLEPLGGDVTVDIQKPLAVGKYLPPNVRKVTVGTRLDGKLHAWGSVDDAHVELLGVTLGNAGLSGTIHKKGDDVRPDGLVLDLPDGRASISGHVYPKRHKLALDFHLTAKRLHDYLRRFRVPPVASGLEADGTVSGTFEAPEANAHLVVSGVPATGTVRLDVAYRAALARLELTRLSAHPLGGALTGSGKLQLGRRPRILDAKLSAAEMNLGNVPGLERILGGRADLDVTASGPLNAPDATISLRGDSLILSGYDVGTAQAQLTLDAGGATLDELMIGGPASGTLALKGRVGFDHTVSLDVDLRRLPLGMLPVVRDDKQLALDGYASLNARVRGSLDAPQIEGRLDLTKLAAWQTLFGSAGLDLQPWPGNRVHVAGKLFQGKFTVDGSVALVPPYDVQGRVAFKRVEIDEFFPALADDLGMHGWVTGWVDAQTAPALMAQVHVTESQVHLDREDDRGRPMPLTVQNRGEMVIAWDGATETATLVTPIVLASPRGEFTVSGSGGRNKLDFSLDGDVQLALLDFWAHRWVESIEGDAKVAVKITGTAAKPVVQGRIAIHEARVRGHGQEQDLRVPSGQITLSNDALGIDHLVFDVDEQKMFVDGRIALKDFHPTRAELTVKGRVSGELLEIALPAQFSEAGGSAAISVKVSGDPFNPDVDGRITFDTGNLNLAPRGFRRLITLTGGRVELSNKELRLDNVSGAIDNARLALSGGVRLFNWSPIDVDVRAQVWGFEQSVPGELSLELNADLRLTGDRDELQLHSGEPGKPAVAIVDGRYYQKFRITDAIVPERTHERSEPFYKGKPLLENLQLQELRVVTSGTFRVDTNLARLGIRGGVEVNGTLARPSIEGLVRADEGTFRIPGVRGEFQIKSLSVDFPPSPIVKKFPEETPNVTLLAETPFIDRSGTEHLVNLRVEGTLTRSKFTFWTSNTGLNNAQTQALLLFGRTTDDLRAKARGDQQQTDKDAIMLQGGAPTESGLVGASDQLIKDLTGEYVALFVEDPIKNALGGLFDTVHIGIGTESVTLAGGKKLGRIMSAKGEYEAGYRGWNRAFVGLDLNFGDTLSLGGQFLRRRPEQETEPVESSLRVQIKLHIPIP